VPIEAILNLRRRWLARRSLCCCLPASGVTVVGVCADGGEAAGARGSARNLAWPYLA
jgi:hypothetical protein